MSHEHRTDRQRLSSDAFHVDGSQESQQKESTTEDQISRMSRTWYVNQQIASTTI